MAAMSFRAKTHLLACKSAVPSLKFPTNQASRPQLLALRCCSCHCTSDNNQAANGKAHEAVDMLRPLQFQLFQMRAACLLLGALPSQAAKAAVAAAADADQAPVDVATYVPGPVEVGWQIWFAAVVSTIPFVIGAYEFGKRILIQRRCQVCGGSGLVQQGRYQRKCPKCGGFFPWISWSRFLSANARPGNGGPLLQPRGQSSMFYKVPPASDSSEAGQQQQPSQSAQAEQPDASSSQEPVEVVAGNDDGPATKNSS